MMSVDPYALAGIDITDFFSPPAWHEDAMCKLYPSVSFFPERGESSGPAKAVCAECTVRAECAAAGQGEAGVWGGTSARERRRTHTRPSPATSPDSVRVG